MYSGIKVEMGCKKGIPQRQLYLTRDKLVH